MDDSPALRAGIRAGDLVLEIEGISTYELPLPECVELLTGEVGTAVNLRVQHTDGTEEDIAVIRQQIVARTVKGLRRMGEDWSYCVDGDLGLSYLRVTQFNADTVNELAMALTELQVDGLNGLILDLRDDPGGGLPTAVSMADLFLDRGTIVTVRPRNGEETSFGARPNGTLPHFPMIVLVNGQSASASEIVAGALQENGRAKVLGTRTYGKGSVQEVRPLRYNSGTLKFTTAHYYLPSGRNINRMPDSETWGVDPDPGFVVPVTDEDYFASLLARREYEIIRNGDPGDLEPCVDADWIREYMLDEQLASAVEALTAKVRGEDWPVITEHDPSLAAFSQELVRATERRVRLIEEVGRVEERIQELQAMADDAGRVPLLPPDAEFLDGTITIRDKHGNVIGTYRVEGGDLALALDTIALTPVDEEAISDER
jgi:carboxyl-terminal processing protease